MLRLFLIGLSVLCVTEAISLRDYCDKQVYEKNGSPKFMHNPQPYILHYYKRCIDHDAWVSCIMKTRKGGVPGVTVRNWEKDFPDEYSMLAAGIVFCQMRLYKLPPSIKTCQYNHTFCDVYDSENKCRVFQNWITCEWNQIRKCDAERLWPILDYEFTLLGRACLESLGRTDLGTQAKSAEDCVSGGPPNMPSILLTLLSTLCCVFGAVTMMA